MNKEELMAFIKENRGNEAGFNNLYNRMEAELAGDAGDQIKKQLTDLKEKTAADYSKAKDVSGAAWPEYEKFVTAFERIVLQL